MKSLYEELGGTYRQVGDFLIPDIELPEGNYQISKYGRMRHRCLKEHCKVQYTTEDVYSVEMVGKITVSQ